MYANLLLRSCVAAAVTVGAFALYMSTLLPGFDLGDTASFQVMGGSPTITPRDGYPLYFAIGSLFTALWPDDPAYALNVASAAQGAVACGLILLVALELSGSLPASIAAAAALGGSYTFWSQSVIAEVYALHVCLVTGALLLLLRWERRPTVPRLAWFFAVYAIAFGNHLSMILLLPGCALFLITATPGGWRSIVAPRIIALAGIIALVASLQYVWNLRALWLMPQPPAGLLDALEAFWFDATKSDWRDTMVLEVPQSMAAERLRMYAFDLGQQFGWLFPIVAIAGFLGLVGVSRARAALVLSVYAVNTLFALGYNVGDSHVFFLPSHVVVALLIAPGIVYLERLTSTRRAILIAALATAAVRIYNDYPALDRSHDTRPRQIVNALTDKLDDRTAVLLTDMNWQLQNGLTYYAKNTRPQVAFARMPEVLLYAPALIRDNMDVGRDVALTGRARDQLSASYGPLFSAELDPRVPAPGLSDRVGGVAAGTRYVICVLRPSREFTIDQADLSDSLMMLTGGKMQRLPQREYVAMAGVVGRPAAAVLSSDRPFRRSLTLDGVSVTIRMESWLAFDTIRRMGFGQVVAARRHTLIVERGISFVAFDMSGEPLSSAYLANIFAAEARYLIAAR
jgi:hypothetical protein